MNERHPEGQVTTQRRGKLFLIGLDRREKMNGLTPKMFDELVAAYQELESNDELWVGVLFAHGDNFTAGLDLPKFRERMKTGQRSNEEAKVDIIYGLKSRMTKPIVTAIQGYTYTAGIEMMLATDMVVAADNCKFSQLEATRGIMATGGATIRFVQRGGWGNAMYHLLTCDQFDVQEAYRIGFVQEIVPTGKQLDRAIELAQQIAKQAPLAVRATKASAMNAITHGEEAAIADFASIQQRLSNTADAAEGVAGFVERREPKFTGK